MEIFSSLKTSLTCFACVTVTTGNWLQQRWEEKSLFRAGRDLKATLDNGTPTPTC